MLHIFFIFQANIVHQVGVRLEHLGQFNLTVQGLVYAFGSSTVRSISKRP